MAEPKSRRGTAARANKTSASGDNDSRAADSPAAEDAVHAFEDLGRKLDERPEVQLAEQAIRHAQAELARARERYREVIETAQHELGELRGKPPSEVWSSVLEVVRRYPAAGVLAAGFVGYLLGRVTSKIARLLRI